MKDDFEAEKIPVISAFLHADNLTDSNYIYLPMASYNEQVLALAGYIDRHHQGNTPKVALYVHPSSFGRGPVEALTSAADVEGDGKTGLKDTLFTIQQAEENSGK